MISKLYIPILRVALLVMFFLLWHITQHSIASYKDHVIFNGCILDQVHHITAFINVYLNQHKQISSLLLTLTTLEVDILALFIFFHSVLSKSARLAIGLILLMCLRQICQTLVLLPVPDGVIWYATGFPTLFVTYDVRNDFFFSGHTALVVYAATAIGQLFKTRKYIVFLKWGLITFQCSVILFLRAHYFMDIFTAFFVAIVVYNFAQKMRLPYWLDTKKSISKLHAN